MPALIPVTTPLEATTVASPVLLLVQLPPVGVADKLVVPPAQITADPVIAAGVLLTVTPVVVVQPVGKV